MSVAFGCLANYRNVSVGVSLNKKPFSLNSTPTTWAKVKEGNKAIKSETSQFISTFAAFKDYANHKGMSTRQFNVTPNVGRLWLHGANKLTPI